MALYCRVSSGISRSDILSTDTQAADRVAVTTAEEEKLHGGIGALQRVNHYPDNNLRDS
jgi:hypothetical protein